MNILHIDSSIQGELSVSRKISKAVVSRLKEISPQSPVIYRDLATDPLPQISPQVIAATHAVDGATHAASEASALTEALDQVLGADVIVIGAPMYNFSIPTQLKTWLDAIAVPGKTFSYGPEGVRGLLGEKRVVVASARGGFYGPDSPAASAEHHETYLRAFFGFLGVTRFEVIRAEGVRIAPEIAERAIEAALTQAIHLQAA
ncbi:NAD(P)H-dependent oxidoreductase [Pseudoxanthomonas sp. F37]|nr:MULTISPECIES: NAD(P)H-dependent oxidoreductase [Pseudoxanthomonas]UOV07059.1 NAD(P)H-dependent oxidoreductase [Pseudoxanthomonas mexicana]UOV10527.1 NAD(P)H-dependent oxidoreductase [Pseudoxanthomonas sp. F37]